MIVNTPHQIDHVVLGYDSSEDVAYQVAQHSLSVHNPNIDVCPLIQDCLRAGGIYTRTKDEKASTDFSLTRFLVPFLMEYQGYSIFADCDFLFTGDLDEIWDYTYSQGAAVYVVKHDYTPKSLTKMNGQQQHVYPKKNWSSFMLFDCAHPALRVLTPSYVNTAHPSDLHQFKWIDESLVGELPLKFNFLVGEYDKPDTTPLALHYTLGVPDVFENTFTSDYADLWRRYRDELTK